MPKGGKPTLDERKAEALRWFNSVDTQWHHTEREVSVWDIGHAKTHAQLDMVRLRLQKCIDNHGDLEWDAPIAQ